MDEPHRVIWTDGEYRCVYVGHGDPFKGPNFVFELHDGRDGLGALRWLPVPCGPENITWRLAAALLEAQEANRG